jgi:hypothetical protein
VLRNKKVFLTSVAALSVLGASAAHADEKWEGDFRKCELTKRFSKGDMITPGKFFPIENEVIIAIGPDEISELEKGIALLKKCNKFWQCVADRGLPGKAKHCYLPRNLP